jgi:hypothetical protein
MPTLRAAVFSKDGNRFLIPGMWSDETDNTRSESDIIIDSMMYRVCLGLESGHDWIEVEVDENGRGDIPHTNVDLHSPAMAHGGCTVLCISGPIFEEARARTLEPV